MRKFYSLLIAGALVAGLVALVGAQGAGVKGQKGPGVQGGQRRSGGRMAEMMGKIQPPLTAEQKKKIEKINSDFRAQFQKMRSTAKPGQRPDMAKMQDLMKKRNDAIMKVLNAKQQASYKKLLADWQKQMEQRRRQGAGRPPASGGDTKPPL
jgi:Spy/CpxP family protein refolding chaperone